MLSMAKSLAILAITLIVAQVCHSSVVVKKSGADIYNQKAVVSDKKNALNSEEIIQPKLELIIDMKNFTDAQVFTNEKKKQRRERMKNRKEKGNKPLRQKNKSQKTVDYVERQILRNNEKMTLVRNKTIEILKNGMRILSTGENYAQYENKSYGTNETLLEKILSSTVSKPDLLLSARGTYRVPIGVGMYETKTITREGKLTEGTFPAANIYNSKHNVMSPSADIDLSTHRDFAAQQIRKERKKSGNPPQETDYDFEYDSLVDVKPNITDDLKSFKRYTGDVDDESISRDYKIGTMLAEIVNALKNLRNCSSNTCMEIDAPQLPNKTKNLGDACQKWLNCNERLERVFSGENNNLPSCPCTYPSTIFYDDTIWDENHRRFFRWRDASGESERLDIYKPGATYCIRSLITQGSSSVSSQQCCFDRKLHLITRGSGAGTINFISPDVSKRLHDIVDMLPWRLCKGDFTRYNSARNPNNANNCPVNPNEDQYQLQIKLSKIF